MIQEANLIWRYVDTDSGLVMPWYTLPCLQWLKEQNVKLWNVFEYGAGYSTIWYAANTRKNFAVDDIKTWAFAVGGENVLYREEASEYIRSIIAPTEDINNDDDLYDCVVIDGKWRHECIPFAVRYLLNGGYLIIDNWGQEDFPHTEAAEKLLEGWEKQLFKQPNHSSWVTAVFKKP